MSSPRPQSGNADAAEIIAFLRDNPGFLAENPGLYRVLTPPARVHGERIADHMAAMLRAERAHAAAMTSKADGVLAAGRATAGLTERVHAAVLALISAADIVDCVTAELPGLLAVDAASLCVEASQTGARTISPGTVVRLLGGRDVVFRSGPADARSLHAEAALLARHDALVRVPMAGPPALLSLAARDAHALDASQGTGALAFLGRAVAAALSR